jgi:hypothetical protein
MSTMEVTPIGATYTVELVSLPKTDVLVLNVFNGINAIILFL